MLVLVGDVSPRVRRVVARRHDICAAAASHLLEDPDRAVRDALASNPSCPFEVLVRRQLAEDARPDGRRQLALSTRWPEVLNRLAVHASPHTRKQVAVSAGASIELLRDLATDKAAQVRAAVASNPRAPADALVDLARDRSENVRRWVLFARRHDPAITAMLRGDHERAESLRARDEQHL